MSAKMEVLITSTIDTICPWCYVGKKRLDIAIAEAQKRGLPLSFTFKYKPYMLDPSLPSPGVDKMTRYKEKFGGDRFKMMLPHMQKVGEAYGIKFSYGGKVGNTLNSHRLLKFADSKGIQINVAAELFKDYFEDEQDISDINVLATAAERAGLNKSEVIEYLKSDKDKSGILQEIVAAQRQQIGGVPFFSINNEFEISGAQDPEVFLQIFEKLAKRAKQ
ncbi:hypothetical protein HDV05_003916 [Chytridiales sp. JEL 0842]|nr:hypothetical protein HDV05_003916 [Chytridiales sp. JEL 0842]